MTLRSDRTGFALPMVILVLGFMTAGVLAAYTRSSSEVRLVDNTHVQTAAFALAQMGLEKYIAIGMVSPLDTTFTLTGGTARVLVDTIKPAPLATDTAVFLIRSIGTTTAAAGRPPGTRTVAMLALKRRGQMQVVSSWTSLSGLHKNGASGDITGTDACGLEATVAGVAVPDGMITGKDEAISGNPDVDEMGTQTEMAAQIKIDWAGITDYQAPAISPNYILCKPGTSGYIAAWVPCTGWPATSVFTTHWPVIVINGSSSLPTDGRGTLIVTGDLTFGGGDEWDGIVLVGGRIVDNGSGNIAGAVVSGLNVLKGETVLESSKANGTKDYSYDSCAVANAADSQARITGVSNAWVDNWTSW